MKSPYETAYQLAQEKLAFLDLTEVAFNSSVSLSDDGLTITFLGETFQITQKGKQIKCLTDNREAKITEKIILLHYLITADGVSLSREVITFESLKGASFYYPTYKARTIDLLLATFQNNIKGFLSVCVHLGAKTESFEHQGKTTFLVLPNIPVNFIYWSGDSEIPPNLQILYDANITHYLPLEDIVVVTELLTHKIIRRVKEDKGSVLYDCP